MIFLCLHFIETFFLCFFFSFVIEEILSNTFCNLSSLSELISTEMFDKSSNRLKSSRSLPHFTFNLHIFVNNYYFFFCLPHKNFSRKKLLEIKELAFERKKSELKNLFGSLPKIFHRLFFSAFKISAFFSNSSNSGCVWAKNWISRLFPLWKSFLEVFFLLFH